MKLTASKHFLSLLVASLFVLMAGAPGNAQAKDYSTMSKSDLQKKIASFGLGFKSYVIGQPLTDEQQSIAVQDKREKAYPGTVKFKDQDIYVIADKESNVVIALYKRNEKADKNDFKAMVSDLMMTYGEPTAEAHGKTIYWNYGEDGLISEELYRTVKSQGKLETLTVLATVKFASSENVETMTAMIEKMEKKEAGEEVEKEITSDNYVMIQSDLLSKKYLNK